MPDYLFVYGTLREEGGHPMHRVLARHASLVDEAVFRGQLYDLGSFPGVIPSKNLKDQVEGEIYHLRRKDQVFQILDRYEGCAGTAPYFRREQREVTLKGGRIVYAWLYLYNRPIKHHPRIPSGDYLTLLRMPSRQAST